MIVFLLGETLSLITFTLLLRLRLWKYTSNETPTQGHTLRTNLLITRPKVYSNATFRCKEVLGLLNGACATGVGVLLKKIEGQTEVNVQIQALDH